MTGFIAWLGIAISHYRFRRGTYCRDTTLTICRTVQVSSLGADLRIHSVSDYHFGPELRRFLKDTIDWGGVAATYIGIPRS